MIKTAKLYYISYPAVSRLVHVTLNLACICHQVLHSPILQCSRVWGGEYGLYTGERTEKMKHSDNMEHQPLFCVHVTKSGYQ